MNPANSSQIVNACTCYGQKQIAAVGSYHEDRAAVATMPATWEPRRAGSILTNYLKQREQDHRTILQELSKDAAKLNAETDAEVRLLAENLQCLIAQNQTTINCTIANNIDTDTPFTSLTAASRDVKLVIVNQIIYQRVEGIRKFKRDAVALERKRADRLRTLLSQNFHRLVAVGNETPNVLLHYFDERVYEANQQLLSNCRAYIELEARLRAQADASAKRARASLNHVCLGMRVSIRRRSSQRFSRRGSDYRPSFSASDAERNETLIPYLKTILGEVGEVDNCVGLIVEAYKAALLKMFNGFSVKLTDLREGLGKHNRIELKSNGFETSELILDMEKNLHRLAIYVNLRKDSNNSKYVVMSTYHDALKLQNTLADLTRRLQTTFDILNDAGHLWDDHIMRSALAQKLTMAAVEDLLTSNDSIELANEILFDIYLDQIRVATDTTKLNQSFQEVIYLLDKTASLYYNHSAAEIECLEQYSNLPGALADTLLAEFNCFLELHPREQAAPSGSNVEVQTPLGLSPQRDSLALTLPLPRILLKSELQWKALQNWKNGFLESFVTNFSVVPEELKSQARSWVDEKIAMINVRYSMKMMSHSIRLERVTAAREARLAELNVHEERLTSHLDAINDLINSVQIEALEFLSIDSPSLYPFCKWMDRFQAMYDDLEECDQLDPETRKLKKSSYGPRLMKHRVLFEDSLDEAIEEFKMAVEQRLQVARISNLRFVSALKLLGEGGNYSPQEAMRTSAALVKAADTLEAGARKICDCLYYRRTELLTLADHLLATVSGAVKEVMKAPINSKKK